MKQLPDAHPRTSLVRKKFTRIAILSLLTLGIFSCGGKDTLVDDTRTFGDKGWNRFKPEVFSVDVKDADNYYQIDFEVVVDTSLMRTNTLPLTVNLFSPSGDRRMFYASISLIENNRWKGEPQPGRTKEGLRLLRQTIRPFFTFNSNGEFRMEIGQASSQFDLDAVKSFRLDIERTEIDYKGMK
ncbi:MAG: hypothetical protein IJ745_00175 [Bacteroidales bacterium]|nr:hypothetical protein [Bacteroidales bacterium]